jgi:HEAT repeat protein
MTRVDLGYALAKLGEEKGRVALQDICQDSGLAPHTRVTAARFMLSFDRENSACPNALIDVIEQGETGFRVEAAALLPEFHDLSPEDSERALQALLKALAAKELVVRHSASQALGLMGNKSAIPYLQSALANEPDEFVRVEMRVDLKKLHEKNSQ